MPVRGASLGDFWRVIQIERAAFGPDSYSITTFLAHAFRDRKGLFVVEDEREAVVGYVLVRVGVRWLGTRRGGITSVAVEGPHRRRGFGSALLARAVEHLREHSVDQADLEVNVANRAARSLYESFGFRCSRILPNYYGPRRDGLKMVLDLRQPAAQERSPALGAERARHG